MYTEELYLEFIKYISIVLVLSIILYFLLEMIRKHRMLKKFDNLAVKSKTKESKLIVNTLRSIDYVLISIFSKIKIIKDYSNKYEKYKVLSKEENSMICFLKKVKVGFLSLIIYLLISLINVKYFSVGGCFLVFILSSYLLEITLETRYIKRKEDIKDNLYKVISLLKASFTSGKTLTQSINYLVNELNGPMKEEFIIIKNDLEYGISLEESFKRMHERYNIKDLKYISDSLVLVNKTNGNIIKILENIESEMLMKRKIKEEYKSVSSGVRLTYKFLLVFPIILILVISLLETNYFLPLITTKIGLLFTTLIILLYILYIILVNKIIKVVVE